MRIIVEGPETEFLKWVTDTMKGTDICLCGHALNDHKHAGRVPCLECDCKEIRKVLSLFEGLKTYAFFTIEGDPGGEDCKCDDHKHDNPMECECCYPCMEYHGAIEQRNCIVSCTTTAELKELFDDFRGQWEDLIVSFIETACQTKL